MVFFRPVCVSCMCSLSRVALRASSSHPLMGWSFTVGGLGSSQRPLPQLCKRGAGKRVDPGLVTKCYFEFLFVLVAWVCHYQHWRLSGAQGDHAIKEH